MIPVYIGFDELEEVAAYVLERSIRARTGCPVSVTHVNNKLLPSDVWWRERGPYDTTEFSNARFAVPMLQQQGWAIFMDADMLCRTDLRELWQQRDHRYAVMCVKHQQEVKEGSKMFGQAQTKYPRKNWSSLMLINCNHMAFTRYRVAQKTGYGNYIEYINYAPGLDLHGFSWLEDDEIGEISGDWNTLLKAGKGHHVPSDLLHWTLGGPWHGHLDYDDTEVWTRELQALLTGTNPCARVGVGIASDGVFISGGYVPIKAGEPLSEEASERCLT